MEVETTPYDEKNNGKQNNNSVRVTILEEMGNSMRMVLSGVDSSFANIWRRTMMGEVDVLAIDRLKIHQNTTMMHDELLFHRLGLIPIQCHFLDQLVRPHECDCDDGCIHCSVKFTLHVINRSDETVEVLTKDLQVESTRGSCGPVRDDILLVKLGSNQELSFTAYAVKSNSRYENNAKWNPVTIASYRPTAIVQVNADLMNQYLSPDEQKRVCSAEPAQVLQYNTNLKRTEAHPDASLRCIYSGDYIEALGDILHPTQKEAEDEKLAAPENHRSEAVNALEEASHKVMRHPTELVHPMISMIPKRDEYLFPIITTGCMPPRQVALKALYALRTRLVTLQMLNRRRHLIFSSFHN